MQRSSGGSQQGTGHGARDQVTVSKQRELGQSRATLGLVPTKADTTSLRRQCLEAKGARAVTCDSVPSATKFATSVQRGFNYAFSTSASVGILARGIELHLVHWSTPLRGEAWAWLGGSRGIVIFLVLGV